MPEEIIKLIEELIDPEIIINLLPNFDINNKITLINSC